MGKDFVEVVEKDLEKINVSFRLNELDDCIHIKHGPQSWNMLESVDKALVNVAMKQLGYGSQKSKKLSIGTMWEVITVIAHYNRFNPILSYLKQAELTYQPANHNNDGIPTPYVIPSLAKYFTNPDGYFGLWFFKWAVGAVIKAQTGHRNPMLVLAGKQTIGKSSFCEWLCRDIAEYFRASGINPDNKDYVLELARIFLWEVDELASTTTRRDQNSLKSFLSRKYAQERKSYGEMIIKKLARASFIGTANLDGTGILNDPTDTTRFLVTEINHIDWQGYTQRFKPMEIWAEASYFARHYPHCQKLTKKEDEARMKINERYEVESPLLEIITNKFNINPAGEYPDWFMTSEQIQSFVSPPYRISSQTSFYNELARTLKRMGIEKYRQPHSQGGLRGWMGIQVKPPQITKLDF